MPQSHKDTKGEENKKLMPGNRRTIRLINYNYAQVGMYYVTICVRKDKCSRGASRSAPTNVKRKQLGRLIGAFKTVSTKQINILNKTPAARIWQRNFYEHVISDESDLNQIREYIVNNPIQWENDEYYSAWGA